MRSFVVDTNVFIDLLLCGRINQLFMLGWEIHTTQFVLAELHDAQQETLSGFAHRPDFRVRSFHFDELEMLQGISFQTRSVTRRIADRSVLYLATETQSILLTGDRDLRKEATAHGIPAHGTLWLVQEWVRCSVLTPSEAVTTLFNLKAVNHRLPQRELTYLIQEYSTMV
jgi:rRNA-processing protein FCF1